MEASSENRLELPPCYSAPVREEGNRARQLLVPTTPARITEAEGQLRAITEDGRSIQIVGSRRSIGPRERRLKASAEDRSDPQRLSAPGALTWIGDLEPSSPEAVAESLENAFTFTVEDEAGGVRGLRTPQIGAVHAVLGHWTLDRQVPATVVMPTGTGKTETMLALFSAVPVRKLIVVVPSKVLRDQIAEKFETLGVLQEFGIVDNASLRPIVGRIEHRFKTTEAAEAFADSCNVMITTPSALFSEDEVTRALLAKCSHLFVDEAHHVEATTWRRIRDEFEEKPVVQFTATPFREDGRQIVGRIIYAFPLRQAQHEGYFSPINYHSIAAFNDPDRAVAEKAIEVLRNDLAEGRDHLLMARVRRIGRAEGLLELYRHVASDLNPVVLDSSLTKTEQRDARDALDRRDSKIVICVNMLGEGFDLPSLKVAAIHDHHKSLGVTLQFVGRFARVSSSEIGEASVVVGRPEGEFDDNLRRLYAENADWNHIVRDLSASAVGEQEEVSEFEEAFGSLPEGISLRNLAPTMAAIAYRTSATTWNPQAILSLYDEDDLVTLPIGVNEQGHVAWFVVESSDAVSWGDLGTLADRTYHLYVFYWDESNQMLYINSSNKTSVHEALAKAVCGDSVNRISGQDVYRAYSGIQRPVPINVGVLDIRNRSRRFSMHAGANVAEGFTVEEASTKTKTNIFAHGYEGGERVTLGAAVKKGRVWSYRVAPTLKHWVDWCDHVGTKLRDDTINTDEIIGSFIKPESLDARPELVALAVEWPSEIYLNTSEETKLRHGDDTWPLIDADIDIRSFSRDGPIEFEVSSPDWSCRYQAVIQDGVTTYSAIDADLQIETRRSATPLTEYFNKVGLTFLLEDDAVIIPPAILLKPERDVAPFDRESLVAVDWGSVNIRRESQGQERDPNTIQGKAIARLRDETWDLMIDDDGSGEMADIVAMRIEGADLVVRLVHCKYASGDSPGHRVADLYDVCGQAQKSLRCRRNVGRFFRHLIRRERARQARGRRTGFEVGDGDALYRLEEESRLLLPRFEIVIAQPGLSKAGASSEQLDLLGATELYLRETAFIPLHVWCSA
jgi:superfamily II DNA or RNA helicase